MSLSSHVLLENTYTSLIYHLKRARLISNDSEDINVRNFKLYAKTFQHTWREALDRAYEREIQGKKICELPNCQNHVELQLDSQNGFHIDVRVERANIIKVLIELALDDKLSSVKLEKVIQLTSDFNNVSKFLRIVHPSCNIVLASDRESYKKEIKDYITATSMCYDSLFFSQIRKKLQDVFRNSRV